MFRHRPIVGFFVKVALLYGLLISPWPYLPTVYLAFFRTSGNLLFHSIGSAGGVRFENESPLDDKWATKLSFENRRTGAKGEMAACSARHGYLTLSLVTALILATPIPWSRRWKSLLFGLALANGILALGMWLGFVDVFSSPGPLAQFVLSPFWTRVLSLATRILTRSLEVPFAVPVFVWLLVTLRHGDVQRWLEASRRGQTASRSRGAS